VHYRFQLFQTAPDRHLLATLEVGKPSAGKTDIEPVLPTPKATGGPANALLLALPFVVLLGLAWLGLAVVREARRAS
jgi:hypothetical protein